MKEKKRQTDRQTRLLLRSLNLFGHSILPIELVTAGEKLHQFMVGLGYRIRYFLTGAP